MGFIDAIRSGFTNYFKFSGRAVRSEYWYWVLFTFAVGIALNIYDIYVFGFDPTPGATQFTPVSWAFQAITFIPSIALGARRLHDTNRSGWWQLLTVAALAGPLAVIYLHFSAFALLTLAILIILIVWMCEEGDPEENRFGTNIFIARRHADTASA
jgi:uncharacterized membrane protein YhaH (DUF805 family)